MSVTSQRVKRMNEGFKPRQITSFYADALTLTKEAISAGKANTVEGLFGTAMLMDLLHGGAYAVPINETPYFAPDFVTDRGSASSPYNPGPLQNQYSIGIGGWLANILGGNNGGALADEVLWNANVPHVLPKLLSDQTMAMLKLLYAQAATTTLFTNAGTGLRTWVEAAQGIAGIATGGQRAQTQRSTQASASTSQNEIEEAILQGQL